MQLFDFLKKQADIGIITQTVRTEAENALADAVVDILGKTNLTVRSIVLDLSSDRMKDLRRTLTEEAPDENDVNPKLTEITTMYGGFLQLGRKLPLHKRRLPLHLALRHTKYRGADISQISRLQTNHPGYKDHIILAEAAHLAAKYTLETETETFLASADEAFVPILHKDGTISDPITKEIFSRFGVLCDWPERIFIELRPFY